jgi:vacuole morphology and inheritance protein 14
VSVKNGAELLDRLIKDIVAEKASNYISVTHPNRSPRPEQAEPSPGSNPPSPHADRSYDDYTTPAFSLPRFIPLLAERIFTLNPFTRMFLVNWITVLDSIPDLELISHLPAFLKGLIQFLSDPNDDVRTATQQALNGFLQDIRKTADVKRMLKSRRRLSQAIIDESDSTSGGSRLPDLADGLAPTIGQINLGERLPEDFDATDDWVPGQDILIDYSKIISILTPFLSDPGRLQKTILIIDELIQLTALRWIDEFFTICPDNLLSFTPTLLSLVLPSLAHSATSLDQAAHRVNDDLSNLILAVPQAPVRVPTPALKAPPITSRMGSLSGASVLSNDDKDSLNAAKESPGRETPTDPFDYYTTVNALTLQFLNEHEETRVAALDWLIMLHKKAPHKVLCLGYAELDSYNRRWDFPSSIEDLV